MNWTAFWLGCAAGPLIVWIASFITVKWLDFCDYHDRTAYWRKK